MRSALLAGAVPATLLVVALAVGQTTHAAFSAASANAGDAITAGTVSVGDDDGATQIFNASGLDRGDGDSRCITVTYGGSLAATVKFYVAGTTGALAPYVNIAVEQGTGGSFADCSGFTSSSTLFIGTLSLLATSATNFASGLGSFAPTGAGQSRTYRITYALSASAPASAQNTSAATSFTWEARNS